MADPAEAANDPFAPLSDADKAGAESLRLVHPVADDDWMPQIPAPADKPPPEAARFGRSGTSSQRWLYRIHTGEIAFAVFRFDHLDETGKPAKDLLPMTYGARSERTGWHWKAPPSPLPLYRLPELIAIPAQPVLVVEGEKTADAAARLFPDMVATTWQGGAHATHKADWAPLCGRTVLLWPDNDAPGRRAADTIGRMAIENGATDVRIVPVPENWPEGWDLADPLPPGIIPDALRNLLDAAQSVWPAAELPDQFVADDAGIWFRPRTTKKNSNANPIWISAPFEILAETNDECGGSWGILLRWQDRGGRDHRWAVPRRLLHAEGNQIAAELEDAGLVVGTTRETHDLLKQLLSLRNPTDVYGVLVGAAGTRPTVA